MDTNHGDQIVRRIVLPSGKTIEVLRVAEEAQHPPALAGPSAAPTAPPDETPAAAHDPHVCAECDSWLVYPVAWTAAGEESWRVELRCPNCELTASAVLDLDVAERFDEELERGAEVLAVDLARLAEANMLDDLERLKNALRADAILPVDF